MKKIVVAAGMLLIPGIAFAGQVGGGKTHRDMVLAGKTDVYILAFQGRQNAHVTVRGDGSTDLDCVVYDSGDNIIEHDTDGTDFCVLDWTPAWTGKFKVKIMNLGHVANEYIIETN